MKLNGWVSIVSLPVVFGLIYYLNTQQQNDIKENRRASQDNTTAVAGIKSDIDWIKSFLIRQDPITAMEVDNNDGKHCPTDTIYIYNTEIETLGIYRTDNLSE